MRESEILHQIRDELTKTNERLDRSIARSDANFFRLEQRMVQKAILRDVRDQLLRLEASDL